jgi:hypothetical protein
VIISGWNELDTHMSIMKIQTVTDSLIETYNPTELGYFGFTVSRTVEATGDQIAVNYIYYSGNVFTVGRDRKDAEKRGHMLAYLLQKYADNLAAKPDAAPMVPSSSTTPPTLAPPTAPPADAQAQAPAIPEDMEAYMRLIRSQIAAGKYDAALSTLAIFRSAIEDKQKAAIPPVQPDAAAAPAINPAPPTPPSSPKDPAVKTDAVPPSPTPSKTPSGPGPGKIPGKIGASDQPSVKK